MNAIKISNAMDNFLTDITMANTPSELDGHVLHLWWFDELDMKGCSNTPSDDYPTVRVEFDSKGGWILG